LTPNGAFSVITSAICPLEPQSVSQEQCGATQRAARGSKGIEDGRDAFLAFNEVMLARFLASILVAA
jgi:hypothetical protein